MKLHIKSQYSVIALLFLFLTLSAGVSAQTPGGIGAMLLLDTAKDGTTLPRIKGLVPNSPAAAQNLPEGSYIIKVNDAPCKNKGLEEIVNTIRGEAGTSVTLLLADNPQGKKGKSYTIVRAAIQQPTGPGTPIADPVTMFYEYGDAEAKKIKKQGFAVVKTFNSDCGDYFFNFDANNTPYHVKVLTAEAKTGGAYSKGFEASANMFDNSDEATKTALKMVNSHEESNMIIAELEGTMTLKRNSIGVVGIQIHALADVKKCIAMYVIVYK